MRIQLNWFNDKLAERIAGIEAGSIEPAAPRHAATVMVLRPGADGAGVEVLLLLRPATMKFAAGAYVFPGGSVDPADSADSAAEIGWYGPSPQEFGARLGAPPELARALVIAAVRETFEEAGVLLAGAPDGGPVAGSSGFAGVSGSSDASLEEDRRALITGELTLAALLARRGLVLRADLLVPWTRWITPAGEPRRFDARFFAAALPAGQRATAHAAEADLAVWLRPADALESARKEQMTLLPPTATTLNEFALVAASGGGVADILASTRAIAPIQPRLAVEDGEAWLYLPDEVGYPL